MATAYSRGGAPALPYGLLSQAITRLSRCELEDLTERLIDLLDQQDGDDDLEPNGDELDASLSEDDYPPLGGWRPGRWSGPGCPIADSDTSADDFGEEEIAI